MIQGSVPDEYRGRVVTLVLIGLIGVGSAG